VKLRISLKSTRLIERLKAESEEKSTVSPGKQFHLLTTRSVKNRHMQKNFDGIASEGENESVMSIKQLIQTQYYLN